MLKNGWWGDASPLDPLMLALITMSLTTIIHQPADLVSVRCRANWQILSTGQSCFEVSAHTALSQFGHFTLKTRVWFQKGGGGVDPKPFPWVHH